MDRKPRSYKEICKAISDKHFEATRRRIILADSTLQWHVNGGTTKSTSNASRGWLSASEEEMVIKFAVEMANRGFPLTHHRLKKHVDEICRAKLGDKFPEGGVGKNWTDRFLERHSDSLSFYWGHHLKDKQGRAVNPTTNKAWFDLLEKTLAGEMDYEFDMDMPGLTGEGEDMDEDENVTEEGDDISECIPIEARDMYRVDESGYNPAGGPRLRVIGPAGKKTQHQQGSSNRENTTVIVTICSDGTSLRPMVIFKGKYFLVRWNQANPAEAS
ncbi:hypothetical protein BDN71DRAFT_1394190 [Pleurotus eryngii]|uniref:HTH CENPB-type domain-containing protein n=1 Tax=Pleurotus eryngii TaxID=5323 RepID=A0A9P5ZSX1_PLEER|nr:hypothetical protein BDN71DRAFT_1394190 [Pleurotus eryngii]